VEQPGGAGRFEVPQWDAKSLAAVRKELKQGDSFDTRRAFGTREEVNARDHLVGGARGWGGNPVKDAVYVSGKPEIADGKTVHRLTLKDVPVDGFWSVSVYNKEGFFEPIPQNAYSVRDKSILLAGSSKAQKYQNRTIQAHYVLIIKTTDLIADPGFRDRRDLVDHNAARNVEAVSFVRLYDQTKQWR
jgi:hypothetical protein